MFIQTILDENLFKTFWISMLLVIILSALLYSLLPWIRAAKLALRLPGPPALPVFGNCLLLTDLEGIKNIGDSCYKKYGGFFRVWLSLLPVFVVVEPDDLKQILGSNRNTNKSFLYTLLHNFIGDGLISHNGTKWKIHRKLMQPNFSLSVLETFVSTFVDGAVSLVDRLNRFAVTGEYVNITSFANECIYDILKEHILGIPVKDNIKKHLEEDSPFRQCKIMAPFRLAYPWLMINSIYKLTQTSGEEKSHKKKLNDFIKESMDRIKVERLQGVRAQKSFMEFLIELSEENPDLFDKEDVIEEACTFMLAGQESVATALALALYFIANDQPVQEKIMNELQVIFDTSDRDCTMNDLNRMHYLEQCIKETLRLFPSIPLLSRKVSEDIPISGKHILPAENNIFIVPYVTHRLPHIYPDPEKFDPDRFTPEQVEKRHPYAFIPFSAGPRNCIGYKFAYFELKTLISTLLRKYHVSLKPGYQFRPTFRVTVRAKGGIWLKLSPRTTH